MLLTANLGSRRARRRHGRRRVRGRPARTALARYRCRVGRALAGTGGSPREGPAHSRAFASHAGGDGDTVADGEGDRSPFGDLREPIALLDGEIGRHGDGAGDRAVPVVDVVADVDLDRLDPPALALRVHA